MQQSDKQKELTHMLDTLIGINQAIQKRYMEVEVRAAIKFPHIPDLKRYQLN